VNLHSRWTLHSLPLWFLVFSLFLPRLTLVVYWLQEDVTPLHITGWLPLFVAVVLPRALILYLIYLDQGISLWFGLHLVVALAVWAGSGSYHTRKQRAN
jgi:hypothetical protein